MLNWTRPACGTNTLSSLNPHKLVAQYLEVHCVWQQKQARAGEGVRSGWLYPRKLQLGVGVGEQLNDPSSFWGGIAAVTCQAKLSPGPWKGRWWSPHPTPIPETPGPSPCWNPFLSLLPYCSQSCCLPGEVESEAVSSRAEEH